MAAKQKSKTQSTGASVPASATSELQAQPSSEKAPAQPAIQQIRISDALKALAMSVSDAWNGVDTLVMESAWLSRAELHYPNEQVAKAQFEKITDFHTQAIKAGVADRSAPSLTNLSVTVHFQDFLPTNLSPLLNGVATTTEAFLPFDQQRINLATSFLAAFDPGQVVSFEIIQEGDGDQKETDACKAAILLTHRAWFSFLKGCLDSIQDTKSHFVVVHENLDISIDGQKHETLSPPARRGLLILTLLRTKQWFSTDEFMSLYINKKPVDSGKDYNNIITNVRKITPRLEYQRDKHLRSISQSQFRVFATEAAIKARLAEHYKDVTSK